MEKNECEKLTEMFDEIGFIERLEWFMKTANNKAQIMIIPPYANYKTIIFPKKLASFVLDSLVSYKNSLKEILANLQVVDKSIIPDEPNPGETENPTE